MNPVPSPSPVEIVEESTPVKFIVLSVVGVLAAALLLQLLTPPAPAAAPAPAPDPEPEPAPEPAPAPGTAPAAPGNDSSA